MNERIRQLADEAAKFSAIMALPTGESGDKLFVEKFAQLIGWEAIGVCRVDVDALTAPFLPEYEKGVVEGYRRANENLRVYFRVEE